MNKSVDLFWKGKDGGEQKADNNYKEWQLKRMSHILILNPILCLYKTYNQKQVRKSSLLKNHFLSNN